MDLINRDNLLDSVIRLDWSCDKQVFRKAVIDLIRSADTVINAPEKYMERISECAHREAHIRASYTDKDRMMEEAYKQLEERFSAMRSAT